MMRRYKRLAAVAAFAGAVPAAAQVRHGPLPIESPGLWVDAADYPPAAIRAGQSGVVRAALDIDAAGRVTGCAIERSSGSPPLDATTCRLAMQRGRFQPAIGADGRPVSGHYTLPIKWALPGPVASWAGDVVIDYVAPSRCTAFIDGAPRRLRIPVCRALIQGIMAMHPVELPEHVPFAATEDMLDPA